MAELIAAGSSRAVEIIREGSCVIECQDGARAARAFASEGAALDAYRARAAELAREGWYLIGCDEELSRPVAWDRAIEAAILDQPEPALLDVYADWLIDHGDPCGELAVLRARAEQVSSNDLEAAIRRLEWTHVEPLFRGFGYARDAADVQLSWCHGWVTAIRCDARSSTRFTLALHAPVSRFVQHLMFPGPPTSAMCAALAAWSRRRQIRYLDLLDRGRVQDMLDALPGLRRLEMPPGADTPLGHPGVRRLVIFEDAAAIWYLGGAWPALEELTLVTHDNTWLKIDARLLPALDGSGCAIHPSAFAHKPGVRVART